MLHKRTKTFCLSAALVFGLVAPVSAQENYPDRPVRLVVGFGAGGPTDIPARFIADKLGTALGHRVIVENKPAAAGMMATRDVLAQPKDGYSLLLCTHFESINVAVYKNVQFRLEDLAPIALISKYYYGLTLSNSVPAADLKSFIAYAKAHPGQINYASIGTGSAQELFARQLEVLTGIKMNRIPFRTGPQVMQELIPGRVQFYVSPMLSVLPLHENKELKVLAISSPERLKSAPQIPTLRENGIDFVRFGWLGICAAAGTPRPIVDLLNRHIAAIVAAPDYQTVTERAGSIPVSSTPEELRQIIFETREQVAATIQEFGLQQEQ
jgi:tripartite-type tricarboxylate transporter receptor subunit TctC